MKRPGSVQTSHLLIKSIEDGVVRLKVDEYRAVIEVRGVSFPLMGAAEQEAVIAGYTAWLNSLDFPIQILVCVLPVDLSAYLEDLSARSPKGTDPLASLAADHLAFVTELVRQRALLDRRYYVVVSAGGEPGRRTWRSALRRRREPDAAEQVVRAQLRARCDAVEQGLARCGLSTRRLGSLELAQLHHACWTPPSSGSQRLRGKLSEHTGVAVRREVWAS